MRSEPRSIYPHLGGLARGFSACCYVDVELGCSRSVRHEALGILASGVSFGVVPDPLLQERCGREVAEVNTDLTLIVAVLLLIAGWTGYVMDKLDKLDDRLKTVEKAIETPQQYPMDIFGPLGMKAMQNQQPKTTEHCLRCMPLDKDFQILSQFISHPPKISAWCPICKDITPWVQMLDKEEDQPK